MAWSGFILEVATLQGLSPVDWPAGQIQDDVDTLVVDQARQYVETLTTSRIASVVAGAGGTEAFFDLAEAESKLATDLQNFVGLAYLYVDWSDIGQRPGIGQGYTKKADALLRDDNRSEGPLTLAAKAFSGVAPVLLGLLTSAAGTAGGSSLALSIDRYV